MGWVKKDAENKEEEGEEKRRGTVLDPETSSTTRVSESCAR